MNTPNTLPMCPADVRGAVRFYLARGFAPIPIPARMKRPTLPGWERFALTPEGIDAAFPPGREMNVGNLNGRPSGGTVDVDLDCPEARAAAPFLLPPTGMVTGRESAPDSHWWYVVDHPPEKAAENFDDPTDAANGHLLELRSTGGQTILPPSVYPADAAKGRSAPERCVWHRQGEPARETAPALRAALGAVAAAALLGRHWPRNRRNQCALALGGGLLRAGWAPERAEAFIRAVCAAARDDEPDNRVGTVAHTAAKLTAGATASGWPTLAGTIGVHGDAVVSTVRRWLGVVAHFPGATAVRVPPPPPRLPEWRPFPVDLLPGAVRPFVGTVARAIGCDPAFVALPALATCAGMIGATRVVHVKESWPEPAILWTAVVGESGTLKSPAYRRALDPVIDMQNALVASHEAAREQYRCAAREYERAKKANRDADPGDPPREPVCARLYSRDTTIEALGPLLHANRTRFLVGRDELAGWLASFDQYKAGGGADRSNWLELHSLGTLCVDRKTGDPRTIFVRAVGVSVCGGIQPGVLRHALSDQDLSAGVAARILFAAPPRRPKVWTDDDIDRATRRAYRALIEALVRLEQVPGESGAPEPLALPLTPEAKAVWVPFYNRFGRVQAETEGDLAAAFSKLEGYAARLALVHHICESVTAGGSATEPVGVGSIRAGIALAEWFTHEAERVYQMLGEDAGAAAARTLIETVRRLAELNGGRVTARQLQRSNGKKYRTREAAEAALESLVGAGLGQWEERAAPSKGRRPARSFVPRPTSDASDATPGEEGDADDGDGPTEPDTAPNRPTPPSGCPAEPFGTNGAPHVTYEHASPPRGEVVSDVSDVSDVGREASEPGGPSSSAPHEDESRVGRNGAASDAAPVPVTTADGVACLAEAVAGWAGAIGLDTETTGLDLRTARVRLVQVAAGDDVAVIDLDALPDPPAALAPLFAALAAKEVIGHNLQFDLRALRPLGFVPGRVFDTMLASRVLRAGDRAENRARLKHGLRDVAARELGRALSKDEQASDWSGRLTPAQLRYAASDAAVLVPLASALKEKLAAAGLSATAETEMRALPGIAWAAPVAVDVPAWLALAGAAEAERQRLAEAMDALAPNPAGLPGMETRNWDSPAQVIEAFAQVGVSVDATDDDTLAGIGHPLAGRLREYRGCAKRAGTYGRAWVEAHAANGDVLPSWNPLGAESGRMSCSDPNLQQVPRGSEYRRCFVARPGCVLVRADYSQIELRIAAKVADEAVMIAAYKDGRDLHTLTAARVLGKPEAGVTKADRQLAKAVNFGLLYGMGWKGLRQYAKANYGVALTDAQARSYRDAFFTAYPALRAWHTRVGADVTARFRADPTGTHEVRTLGGRRRVLPVAKRSADGSLYANKQDALNTPVQGTGADGLKRGIALLWERRAECPGAVPVIFAHDEIVVEVPEAGAARAAAWLRGCMVGALAPLLAPVPVEVEVTVGRSWGG